MSNLLNSWKPIKSKQNSTISKDSQKSGAKAVEPPIKPAIAFDFNKFLSANNKKEEEKLKPNALNFDDDDDLGNIPAFLKEPEPSKIEKIEQPPKPKQSSLLNCLDDEDSDDLNMGM